MKVRLGYDPSTSSREPVFFYDSVPYGNIIIAAVSRYGKSAIMKLIMSLLQFYRKFIILDFQGEFSQTIFPNTKSKGQMLGMRNMKIVNNFAFRISDFNSEGDWISLGFPEMACKQMARFAKMRQLHHDSTENFRRIIHELPTENAKLSLPSYNAWCKKEFGYDPHLDVKFNDKTQQSMITRFDQVMAAGYFKMENDGKKYVENFGRMMLENGHLCIDLGLTTGTGQSKAQAYFGKVLEQMIPYLAVCRPFIIVEEASVLAPNLVVPDEMRPSSLRHLINYAVRYQRYGIKVAYIVQDLQMLYPSIRENYHMQILGQLQWTGDERTQGLVRRLRWNARENYREFIIQEAGQWRISKFVPDSCPCEC